VDHVSAWESFRSELERVSANGTLIVDSKQLLHSGIGELGVDFGDSHVVALDGSKLLQYVRDDGFDVD
jgi:hypothetical protein